MLLAAAQSSLHSSKTISTRVPYESVTERKSTVFFDKCLCCWSQYNPLYWHILVCLECHWVQQHRGALEPFHNISIYLSLCCQQSPWQRKSLFGCELPWRTGLLCVRVKGLSDISAFFLGVKPLCWPSFIPASVRNVLLNQRERLTCVCRLKWHIHPYNV